MARYWIADLHLGHAKTAEMRGFNGVNDHDRTIIAQLDKLTADDEVWVLGDISSGRPEGEAEALELLLDVRADLHLIAGNHDSVSSIHRNGYKQQRRWLEVFETVQQFGRVRLNGRNVLMSHYPYTRSGDGPGRGEARYAEYRLPDAGLPLIHGHTHQDAPHMQLDPEKWFGIGLTDHMQFCVSWDARRRLVTEHDLNQWLERCQLPGIRTTKEAHGSD